MNEHFDVIVVGLGPGGAAATIELARAGARVLALDGRKARSKACGGCISARWEGILHLLDAPNWFWEHPVMSLRLCAPGQRPVLGHADKPGAYLVERPRLDEFLAEQAAVSGARVIKARATGITHEKDGFSVEAGGYKYRAQWLIGADGAGGLCGRRLDLGGSSFIYAALAEETGLQESLDAGADGEVILELGGVHRGYAWAFLRGDVVNLGVGAWKRRGRSANHGLVKLYGRFLGRFGLKTPGSFSGAAIPCPDGRPCKVVSGRACVVGDAAGLADPFLGEGIGPALLSGRLAARAVLKGDLNKYSEKLSQGLLREFGHARFLAHLVFGAPMIAHSLVRRHPGSLQLGFALLRGELSYARLWRAVGQKILGRQPFLDRRPQDNYIE